MGSKIFSILLIVAFAASHVCAQTAEPEKTAGTGVTYGFVVDNSGSYRLLLDRVIDLVSNILEKNDEGDESFLVTFVDAEKISMRQELTREKREILDAAENMYIQGGQTAILDGLRFSLEYLAANGKSEGRPLAIVLITDGDERNSAAKIERVIALARDAKVRVIAVGISDEKVHTKLLDRITKETGGKAFYPRNRTEQKTMVEGIAKAIRGN